MNIANCGKKIGVVGLSVVILLGVTSPVLAMDGSTMRMEKKEAKIEGAMKRVAVSGMPGVANKEEKVERLKEKAIKEIDRRIESLNKLIEKVKLIQRLSDAQKSSFVSNIQAEIDALNTLKSAVEGGTDLETLRSDVKSIVSSHRIYALYVPQLHILIGADALGDTVDRFSSLADKLQTRIDEAKSAGNDVMALETALGEMQAEIAKAKAAVDGAIGTVSGLTPGGYPGNKISLQSARTMLQTARENLRSAGEDARLMMQGLKEMRMTPGGMEEKQTLQ